jgi:hypothetical protein
VASQRAKRKQRQRGAPPRAAPSDRRAQQAERVSERRAGERLLGTVGERPPSPFGGLPVSELLILAGGVSAVVGAIGGGGPALIVGLAVVGLGVLEFTAREHFSGYRSHTTLLAAIPTVAVEFGLISTVSSHTTRGVLLLMIVPVFAGLFFLLRRTFLVARQRRVARR